MSKILKAKTINSIIVEYLEYCNYKNLRLSTIKSYHKALIIFKRKDEIYLIIEIKLKSMLIVAILIPALVTTIFGFRFRLGG